MGPAQVLFANAVWRFGVFALPLPRWVLGRVPGVPGALGFLGIEGNFTECFRQGPRPCCCGPVFCVAPGFLLFRGRGGFVWSLSLVGVSVGGVNRPKGQVEQKKGADAPTPCGAKNGGKRNHCQPCSQSITQLAMQPVSQSVSQQVISQSVRHSVRYALIQPSRQSTPRRMRYATQSFLGSNLGAVDRRPPL